MIDAYAYAKQGRRPYMEDRHVLRVEENKLVGAVFDGHGGDVVATAASEMLLNEYDKQNGSLWYAFLDVEKTVRGYYDGACAVVFELLDFGKTMRLEVLNVGDCELVYLTGGPQTYTVMHRPENNPEEAMRVLKAGASIQLPYWYTPTGQGLMITRTLGDAGFQKWGLISDPHRQIVTFDREPAWLIAASDGLWDVVKKEDLSELLGSCDSARAAAEWLVDEAITARKAHDNVSVIVARIGDWE